MLSYTQFTSFYFTVTLLLCVPHLFFIKYSPGEFMPGDKVQIKASQLTSAKAQLTYDYLSLDYCQPPGTHHDEETLHEFLQGNHLRDSAYQILFNISQYKVENQLCRRVRGVKLDSESVGHFKEIIDNGYQANLYLDNRPLAVSERSYWYDERLCPFCQLGFRMGYKENGRYFLNKTEQ